MSKKATKTVAPADAPAAEEKKLSRHAQRNLDVKKKDAKIDPLLDGQFAAGRLYASISSRPGQSGRADGYILEGKELEVCSFGPFVNFSLVRSSDAVVLVGNSSTSASFAPASKSMHSKLCMRSLGYHGRTSQIFFCCTVSFTSLLESSSSDPVTYRRHHHHYYRTMSFVSSTKYDMPCVKQPASLPTSDRFSVFRIHRTDPGHATT